MKKVIRISLILLMAICISGNVYAALKCNIDMKIEESEYNKGDTFTVHVNISNIESERGVISFGGTLKYDKDSLKLEKMEGVNGWETPTIGVSYNETNGKFITTRSGLGKNDETIFELTFTVKNESKQNPTITLKDMTLADGTSPAKVNEISKSITVKEGVEKPNPKPGDGNTDNDSKPGNNSGADNSSKPGNNSNTNNSYNTTTDKKIPQTGDKSLVIPIWIVVISTIAIVCFVKIRKINK